MRFHGTHPKTNSHSSDFVIAKREPKRETGNLRVCACICMRASVGLRNCLHLCLCLHLHLHLHPRLREQVHKQKNLQDYDFSSIQLFSSETERQFEKRQNLIAIKCHTLSSSNCNFLISTDDSACRNE